jgi:5-methylcytosine-specific restriction endonuclease McrA
MRSRNPDQPIKTRVHNMYQAMTKRHSVKYWKTGRRKGLVRVPAIPIPFTEAELFEWTMALGEAFHCPYCNAWLNRMIFSIDHIIPLSRGGSLELGNLDGICKDCNAYKGNLTGQEYYDLIRALDAFSPEAQKSVYQRLKSGGFRWANKPRELAA